MRIVHSLHSGEVRKQEESENSGFLLTNRYGGYLWLARAPLSRYQGWFVAMRETVGQKLYKVIENIEVEGGGEITEIRNNVWSVERRRARVRERFWLPHFRNVLVYEVNEVSSFHLIFDSKESYDNSEDGRVYDVSAQGNCAVIAYHNSNGRDPEHFYCAVQSDASEIIPTGEWIARDYRFDRERASPPFFRSVYAAARMRGRTMVCVASTDRKAAIREARDVFKNRSRLKMLRKREGECPGALPKQGEREIVAAYTAAFQSIKSMVVKTDETARNFRMCAGLPWFFQFWSRDEAVSLRGLMAACPKEAKSIFWRIMETLEEDGMIPDAPDAVFWAFKRAEDFIVEKQWNMEEVEKLGAYLRKAVHGLQLHHTTEDLTAHESNQTWMDSINRGQAVIEIQAGRLGLHRLDQIVADPWLGHMFRSALEKQLAARIRSLFWNGLILADAVNLDKKAPDWIIRPNIFLAAYLYPKLLTKEEWIRCFEYALSRLWLPWGGLASVDRESPLFHSVHSGETAASYHNGDSWFYLNNLVGVVLYRADRARFKKYINAILEASAKEILWHGIVGHHAELSSARELRSEGCLAQSWSSALYIEFASLLQWRFL